MATDLTTIFGNEIIVAALPPIVERQFTGFPGGHGLVSMDLGSRGRQLIIRGRLAETGSDYNTARANLQDELDDIQDYLFAEAADYKFKSQTFYSVVFNQLQLVPDGAGRHYHWTAEGKVMVSFICCGQCLI